MSELLKIYPENPVGRQLSKVIDVLNHGGVIIYPTDTVYGIGCDIFNQKAVERVARIKGLKPEKANFSFICYDLSHISDFASRIDNNTFKLMKKCLPGPYTFILPAGNQVPNLFKSPKKTVGIRIPDNSIMRELVRQLGHPIMTTSLKDDNDIVEYMTDPGLIFERYQKLVDIVIDGGYGDTRFSTIIDCTGAQPIVIREGKGDVENL
jgi:tRNA threonylcarbamoyl adenosine modification protein (Sua5/YciO/YrdC/YwlC family)